MQIAKRISGAAIVLLAMSGASAQAKDSLEKLSREAACQTLDLASTGAPQPSDKNVVVLRWLATSNFEIAYRDNVFLLDAFYDRAPPARPVGFDFQRMNKANGIFIGHAHYDHISDAVAVAQQTGARVFGGPQTYDYVRANGLPEAQAVLTKGGETIKFNGVTVQAVLAQHSDLLGVIDKVKKGMGGFSAIKEAYIRPQTAEEQAHSAAIRKRGSSDAKIMTEGTIGYLFTFDNGFRLYYQDSAGPVTEAQKELMKSIPGVDLAIVAYQGYFLSEPQTEVTMPMVRLLKPRIVVPDHHDETGGSFPDLATEPLFMAIRDEFPNTRAYAPLYRSPMCINTADGQVFMGPSVTAASKKR